MCAHDIRKKHKEVRSITSVLVLHEFVFYTTRSHIQRCHIWGSNPHVPYYDAPSTLFYSQPGSDSIHSARYDISPSRCAGRSFHLSLSKRFLEFFSFAALCLQHNIGRAGFNRDRDTESTGPEVNNFSKQGNHHRNDKTTATQRALCRVRFCQETPQDR